MRPYAANAFALPPSDPSVYRVRCSARSLRDLLLDLITSEDTSLTVCDSLDDSDFLIAHHLLRFRQCSVAETEH